MDFAAGRIRVLITKAKMIQGGAELAALPERGLCGRHGLMGGVLPGRAAAAGSAKARSAYRTSLPASKRAQWWRT